MSSRVDMEVSDDQGATWHPLVASNVANTAVAMWRNAVGEWTPPPHVLLAMQHHLAVSGGDVGYVVGLFGGVSTRIFAIERDPELIADIEATIRDFWDCVEKDRQPAISGARDAAVIARINSQIDPDAPIVNAEGREDLLALIEDRAALSAQKNKLDKQIRDISATLADKMKGLAGLIVSDKKMLAWTYVSAGTVSYERRASARLQLRKIQDRSSGSSAAKLAAND
jgi:predicted phage-related endonuclease